jgi:hypothetical protein
LITVTDQAREFMEAQRSGAPDLKWYLIVHWQKGEMENRRGTDGEPIWERLPDPGWSAEFVGYRPGDVPEDLGGTLMPGVRILVDPVFVSGVVDLEQGKLKVRSNAV